MSVMKSTWRVECADSACPASEVPICPEAEGMAPTEHTSMKTSTPSVIFDLDTGERGYTQSMQSLPKEVIFHKGGDTRKQVS